jgi:hypothetical protein
MLSEAEKIKIKNSILFTGFIWGPATPFADEILEYINKIAPIIHCYKFKFTDKELFEKAISNMYSTDNCDQKWIKNIKCKYFSEHPNGLVFTYFQCYIKEPIKYLKGRTPKDRYPLAKIVPMIKLVIRNKYKSKIKNYIHDVIIHLSDNYKQSKEVKNIMEKYKKYIVTENHKI